MGCRAKWLAIAAAVALAGCNKADEHAGHDHGDEHGHTHAEKGESGPPSPELAKLVLTSGAPEQFVGVAQARQEAKNGDQVVLQGRVKDFVDGRAVFTIMDSSIPSCSDVPGDNCPTPWDYCCETKESIVANTATVQLVDEEGKPYKGNIKGLNDLDNLTTVVAQGKAIRDESGNLVVAANQIYLKE